MKRRKKGYIITGAAVIIAALATFIGWGYLKLDQQERNVDVDLYTFIPANSDAIVEMQSLDVLDKTIRHSCFEQTYNELDVSALTTFILENRKQLSVLQPRGKASKLVLSFHQPETKHDQVIYGQTAKEEAEEYVRQAVNHFFPTSNAAKKAAYHEEEITIYPIGRQFLACWFKDGAFAISLQKRLIEDVIDAYKGGKHAMTHPTLATLRRQRKSHGAVTLYFNDAHQNVWREIDIRMNHEAIYLAESKTENDTTRQQTANIENLNSETLPGHVRMAYQTILNQKGEETPLVQLLHEQGCLELTYLMFTPKDSAHTCHQLLVAPIPANNMNEARTAIRYGIGAKRQPSIWTNERAYPVWIYNSPKDGINKYFVQTKQDTICYLALSEDKLYVAPTREALRDYIKEMTDNNISASTPYDVNRKRYIHSLGKLSEETSFTLVADMKELMQADTTGFKPSNNKLIPAFFTQYPTFFRQFIYCKQVGESNGITLLWQAGE